jgi:hypothetical protein
MGRVSRAGVEDLLASRSEGHQLIRLLKLQDPDAPDEDEQPRLVSQIARIAVEAYRRDAISRGRLLDVCEKLGIREGERLLELARSGQG